MIRALKKIETYFAKDLWDLDINSLGRMRALQVKFLRLATVFVSELSGEQLALRAMSLVYTTLLTIVPLLAVSFSVLKAFGVHTKLEVLLSSFLEPLGPGGINLSLRIIEFVERVNVGVLGAFGLSALLYTVISQIQKIEVSLNFIWHVSKPRSFSRRVTAYMSILLVGPVLGFSAIGLSAYLMESSLVRRLLSVETVGSAAYLAGHGMTYLLICAFFVFVYVSLPNTKVHFASALVGGIFAGIVWKIMGLVFASFIVTSTQYSAIYSGFALGILFLIWLYWSWFILLVGARVSFYHQYPRLLDFRKESLRLSTRQREKLAMLIMFLIGYNFYYNKGPWKLDSLLSRLVLPPDMVQDMLFLLEKKGLIFSMGDERQAYLPAKDIETISLREIFDSVRTEGEDSLLLDAKSLTLPEIEDIMKCADDSLAASLGKTTIKDLVLSHKGVM